MLSLSDVKDLPFISDVHVQFYTPLLLSIWVEFLLCDALQIKYITYVRISESFLYVANNCEIYNKMSPCNCHQGC